MDRLELMLREVLIPPLATWIDSPGINDTTQMNERALHAARQGDMLIWILSSRQPLSEVEMEFIAQYIAERGPRAVTFLLNAFLTEDTQHDWERFLQKKLHVYRNKVNDHAALMGFTPQITPAMLVVAGRALYEQDTDDFGGSELRHFLLSFTSGEIRAIQRIRLQRAEIALRAIAREIQEKVQEEQAKLAQEQLRKAQQDAQRCSSSFKRALEECMHAFVTAWSTHIRSTSMAICNQITSQTLFYDHYQAINYHMGNITTKTVRILFGQIDKTIYQYSNVPLSADARAALIAMFAPPYVQAVAPSWSGSNGIDKAIHATRMTVQSVTEQAIAAYLGRQQEAICTVLTCCVASTSSVQQPDMTELRRLEAILQSLTELVGEAARLAE